MALIGYARTSTADQDPALQLDALEAAGCERVFKDVTSGGTVSRPQLDKMLDHLRPDDVVVVWRLDRLGRSTKHLISLVEDLHERGVGLRSLTESIDTTTAGGKFIFTVFGALAEFERDIIRERTRAGLEAARARGRKGGRPSKLNPEKVAHARTLYEGREHTVDEIAGILGVSRKTIYRHLQGSRSRERDTRLR